MVSNSDLPERCCWMKMRKWKLLPSFDEIFFTQEKRKAFMTVCVLRFQKPQDVHSWMFSNHIFPCLWFKRCKGSIKQYSTQVIVPSFTLSASKWVISYVPQLMEFSFVLVLFFFGKFTSSKVRVILLEIWLKPFLGAAFRIPRLRCVRKNWHHIARFQSSVTVVHLVASDAEKILQSLLL